MKINCMAGVTCFCGRVLVHRPDEGRATAFGMVWRLLLGAGNRCARCNCPLYFREPECSNCGQPIDWRSKKAKSTKKRGGKNGRK